MNPIRSSKMLMVLLGLVVLVGSWGCQNKSSLDPTNVSEDEQITPIEKLIPAPDTRLPDVPIPLGAKFKAKSSSSYETGGRRTVTYNYGIWAKQPLVRIFYKDNMPVHNWQPISSITTGRMDCLSFKKGDEFCNVTIGPHNWYFQTLIRIEIQPVDVFQSGSRFKTRFRCENEQFCRLARNEDSGLFGEYVESE